MTLWLAVAVSGGLGALARVGIGQAIAHWRPGPFPMGTLAVNLLGALALGLLVGSAPSREALVLLGGGFLGSFTTFSTWMVESVALVRAGRQRLAVLNLLGATAAGLVATAVGLVVGAAL